jgi:hypothetical protein
MSLGKVWIGHKLSRRMPLVNWQRLQEIGSYLSTLCDFCFRFGFRFCLRFSFRFWLRSYATCKLTAPMCFAVQNHQLIAAVQCAPYFLLLYSLYCISNSFWNILDVPCSVYSFIYLFQKYFLASSGVLFSQLLTEHKNHAANVVVTA